MSYIDKLNNPIILISSNKSPSLNLICYFKILMFILISVFQSFRYAHKESSPQPFQLEKTHLYTSQLYPKLPSKSQKPSNARTFFNLIFPLKSLIKLDLPENSVQTEQEALPESSRYSQFMYRHPFQSTSEKGLTCRLPTEEANSLKQIDRNLAQILPKSHNLFSEKEKRTKKKTEKKSTEKRIFTIHS